MTSCISDVQSRFSKGVFADGGNSGGCASFLIVRCPVNRRMRTRAPAALKGCYRWCGHGRKNRRWDCPQFPLATMLGYEARLLTSERGQRVVPSPPVHAAQRAGHAAVSGYRATPEYCKTQCAGARSRLGAMCRCCKAADSAVHQPHAAKVVIGFIRRPLKMTE